MHYRVDGTPLFQSESGLSFHLHNGTTTNAFCINSGDLMTVSGANVKSMRLYWGVRG